MRSTSPPAFVPPRVVTGRNTPTEPDLAQQRVEQTEGHRGLAGESLGRGDVDAAAHGANLSRADGTGQGLPTRPGAGLGTTLGRH